MSATALVLAVIVAMSAVGAAPAPLRITVDPAKLRQEYQGMGCGVMFYEGHVTSLAARQKDQRQRELMMREGPRPKQAIAEALSALHALASMGKWPGPRDPVAESEVARVRERWTRIGKRARAAAKTLGR